MIHSMAGGSLGTVNCNDFAKVKITQGVLAGDIYWYICSGLNVQAGSKVLVPVGTSNTIVQAEVIRVDKGVSNFCSPVPTRRAKRIEQVLSI